MNDQEQDISELIKAEYLRVLQETGHEPETVLAFSLEIGIEASEFHSRYSSFKALEKEIWHNIFQHVNIALDLDAEYLTYSGKDKVLSFHYTLIEVYKQNQSFVKHRLTGLSRQSFEPWFLKEFKVAYIEMINSILSEAITSEEIIERLYISDYYKDVLWLQFLYVSRVWANDNSKDYQITDAAIEKSVNLLFELMRKGPLDMAIEFAKFMYQNKAY